MLKNSPDPIIPPYENPNNPYPNNNNSIYPPQSSRPLLIPQNNVHFNPNNIHIEISMPSHPISITLFGMLSMNAHCPSCKTDVYTKTKAYMGCFVWVMVLILFFTSPCISCIPCFIVPWYDVAHFCPNCSHRIGTFARI